MSIPIGGSSPIDPYNAVSQLEAMAELERRNAVLLEENEALKTELRVQKNQNELLSASSQSASSSEISRMQKQIAELLEEVEVFRGERSDRADAQKSANQTRDAKASSDSADKIAALEAENARLRLRGKHYETSLQQLHRQLETLRHTFSALKLQLHRES